MLDFVRAMEEEGKRGVIKISPEFIPKEDGDLMIKGGAFYAIWDEGRGFWSTNQETALRLIDQDLDEHAAEQRQKHPDQVYKVQYVHNTSNRMIKRWHTFCNDDMYDTFTPLDEKLTFLTDRTKRTDYATKCLKYALEDKETPAYDRLMSVLYSPEEKHKVEWAIGCILSGDSVKTQKFLVFYGPGGTGKSTVINIIQDLFKGYYSVFDAKSVGSANATFALEAFKDNPLVAIQHDGDLSKIEDNTRLNSIISHETMLMNEKFRSQYPTKFKCFLIMGTNKPVRITDARSGLLRRLIDVSPTGNILNTKEYDQIQERIPFELGGIAYHCLQVYKKDPKFYNNYIPYSMMGASNDFYNYVADNYFLLSQPEGISARAAYTEYVKYCEQANFQFKLSERAFREELKTYFEEYEERHRAADGTRIRSWYTGFRKDRIEGLEPDEKTDKEDTEQLYSIEFEEQPSVLDDFLKDMPAQYASSEETPRKAWDDVKTVLMQLNTHRLHYVRVPENLIVIDFDIPDQNGEKSFERNLEEASKWPPTYAELSKSGKGIHLHYIYDGDPSKLAYLYKEHVEIKVFTGKSSLRRKLTKCNNLPIATLGPGSYLPLKEEKPMVGEKTIKNAQSLQRFIVNCLEKKYEPHATKPSIDFIYTKLEEAYNSGIPYDVTHMRDSIRNFALASTHNAEYCLKIVNKMKFKSNVDSPVVEPDEGTMVVFDVEVFPNLFLLCWKPIGKDKIVERWFNPSPEQVKSLFKYRLIGFNNRRYDNHILWAAGVCEYSPMQLYLLSQKIISGDKNAFFGDAYNLSYTDIYDFSAKKQSLKKFEIELKIDHKELGMKWDEPVPQDRWEEVADYCVNDVVSTEAVWNARQGDFAARKILAAVAGGIPNDTTNSLTTKIIFRNDKNPQKQFNYRFMGDMTDIPMNPPEDEFTLFDMKGRPIFKGYTYQNGKSTYRGEEVGEGGYVYAEPGIYGNVALLDIASMHPHSIIAEELFGPVYTKRFRELVEARIAIKHKDFEKAASMLDGVLVPFLKEELVKDLAQALKIAINSVYGLTAAKFQNAFRDPRNVDNIVAKRGALFMVNLKHEVQKRGFTVAHIKTDSIKIPDATPEIIQFVMDYGKKYGYNFEHEDTYDRMCLVNDAVYIAKYKEPHKNEATGEDIWWTATGTQFQVPYVFKTLFSKEPIEFDDMCETKSVQTAIYLDFNEQYQNEDQHFYTFVGKVGKFSPVKEGCGGGLLLRDNGHGYSAVTGTKGYRWKESEVIRLLGLEDQINRDYYENLVREAVGTICAYGDFTWFVSDDPYVPFTEIVA